MAETDGKARAISLMGATGIGVGAIVGGGVLALAGSAFHIAGPSTILAFALNAVIAFMTAASFAEMCTAFPENGGAYAFTRKVLSVRAAFAVGWILWFASIAAAVLYALGFAAYLAGSVSAIWGDSAPAWLAGRSAAVILSVAAIGFYTIILTRSKGGGGNMETIGKLIVFGIIIIAGLVVLGGSDTKAEDVGQLKDFMPGGITGLVTVMGFTFIALQGFDIIAAVAGEVKDPRRNMPRSMFYSLGVALVVYIPLLFLVATVGVTKGSSVVEMANSNEETMIAVAIGNFMGPSGFWLVMGAGLLSMLSALYANLLAASRIAATMSRDRTLPRFMSVINDKTGNPVKAVLVTSAITCLILLAVKNVKSAGAAASLIFLLSFTLTHITSYLARRRGGIPASAFRVPFFPLVPIVGAVLCASLALFQAFAEKPAGAIVAVWLILGFLLYFTSLADRAEVLDARTFGHDPALAQLRGRSPLVLVPMHNPAHAKAMVETAAAISPPTVGRVLLLSVVRRIDPSETTLSIGKLQHTQDLVGQALMAAMGDSTVAAPEALITMAPDPWVEIQRVARVHRCESLLLGLTDLSQAEAGTPLETLIATIDCDVVVMRAPNGWSIRDAHRILVPVGGAGIHDELRARLLGALGRGLDREVTFLRVVPPTMSDRDLGRVEELLRHEANDETPGTPIVQVVRSDDPLATVTKFAADSDLVILGMQRKGTGRSIGRFALAVAKAANGATILISHAE